MWCTLRCNYTLRHRNLVLIFVTPDTGDNFTRLSGQPTTHQLYSSSVFINRLDGDWSIGWYFEDNRTVFFHRNCSELTFNVPSALDTMPVMVRNSFQICILIRMQAEFFYSTTRYITQSFTFVYILDKYSCFFFIQFYPVRYSRRSSCLTHNNRTDVSFAFLFHQTSYVIKYVHQINTP